jgi:Zn-dependent M28 family amino/carboxypeptidase
MNDPHEEFHFPSVREALYRHVEYLSVQIGERHLWKEDSLSKAAEYIRSQLASFGYPLEQQSYRCEDSSVWNLWVEKKGRSPQVLVVGAHYDTVPGTPGADDNASGVAILLELARVLRESSTRQGLLLAAWVNEEPPFFGTPQMGSMVFARSLRERGTPVEVMMSLEMVGYFQAAPIQRFPLPGMGLFYPRIADYIGVVGNLRSSRYVSLIKKGLRRNCRLRVHSLAAPAHFGGIHLSDHLSFWRQGYRALMITDTAFYRNPHYHLESDTIDTLNFDSMAELVRGLSLTLSQM